MTNFESLKKKVLKLNQLALNNTSLEKAQLQLDKAKMLLKAQHTPGLNSELATLLSITLNNKSCLCKKYINHYFRQRKYNEALIYLSEALKELETYEIQNKLEYCCTLLNVCAILSTLHK